VDERFLSSQSFSRTRLSLVNKLTELFRIQYCNVVRSALAGISCLALFGPPQELGLVASDAGYVFSSFCTFLRQYSSRPLLYSVTKFRNSSTISQPAPSISLFKIRTIHVINSFSVFVLEPGSCSTEEFKH